jgi:RNA polymerase sigma-70 factor (ECF subfamily)
MEPAPTELEVLLAAYRGGDSAARDELLGRCRDWLDLLARVQRARRLQGKFDASDVVQQAILEAYRSLPAFRGTTSQELLAWLRGVLANVLAHEVRRYAGTQQRDPRREVSLEQELAESSRRLAAALAADQSSPSALADRREQEARLLEVLARLPPDYREVIVLRNLEGLSHEEVAERLGRGAGAVRMLWVRALARLRREMEKGA